MEVQKPGLERGLLDQWGMSLKKLVFFMIFVLTPPQALGAEEGSLFDLVAKPYLVTADRETSQILADCPPSECQYVSMGLTNTLFDSFLRIKLKALGLDPSEIITYAPYLGLKHAVMDWPGAHREELFRTFLPQRVVKKILFLRTLHSGLSVKAFFEHFGPFMKEHFPETEVAAHFLVVNQEVAAHVGPKKDFKYVINKEYVDHIAMRKRVWNKNDYIHELDDFYQIKPLSLEWMAPENFYFRYRLIENPAAQNLDHALKEYLNHPEREFIKAPAVPVKKSAFDRVKSLVQSCSRLLQ